MIGNRTKPTAQSPPALAGGTGTFTLGWRFFAWVAVNLLLWPLIRPILKSLHLIDYVFVVYPGTTGDITSYIPLWMYSGIRGRLPVSVLGISTRGESGKRGLTLTIMFTPDELKKDDEKFLSILNELERTTHRVGAEAIAMAGVLPGQAKFQLRDKERLSSMFLPGDRGSVHTVTSTVLRVLVDYDLPPETRIGVLGSGFLGNKVRQALNELGIRNVIGIDPRFTKPNGRQTNNPAELANCKIVVVLTREGADIEGDIGWMQKNVIVIDDTHPQLPVALVERIKAQKRGAVLKAALGSPGVHFSPAIPGYAADWLPGCLIEAIVCLSTSTMGTTLSHKEFTQAAEATQIQPLMLDSRGGT